ncbi:E3 ubiquitin-protein ligase rnf146-like [Pollicipes pollicipes]|uniref:E3 ubiquitin-protein ligase rnf146-like n=1 Tax=Pollicipes pollicipes TaxID=41117 RepID=UPI001884CCA8|nr:E3 ubiquitin-protein ligase rnf146-like [Pollicipes pollicipes]
MDSRSQLDSAASGSTQVAAAAPGPPPPAARGRATGGARRETRRGTRRSPRSAGGQSVFGLHGSDGDGSLAQHTTAGSVPPTNLGCSGSSGCDTPAVATGISQPSASQAEGSSSRPQTDSASGGGEVEGGRPSSPPDAAGSAASNAVQSPAGGSAPSASEASPQHDCGICLEKCLHPVKLPCGHVFCFLCVKGAAKVSQRCAYCRAEVSDRYLNNPRLLDESELERSLDTSSQQHHWLYRGRNGWWRYDERTSQEIEAAFVAQQTSLQVQVAGELYTIDLTSMTQHNDQCHGRRRRIRRDAPDAAATRCKGVAGLRKRARRQ